MQSTLAMVALLYFLDSSSQVGARRLQCPPIASLVDVFPISSFARLTPRSKELHKDGVISTNFGVEGLLVELLLSQNRADEGDQEGKNYEELHFCSNVSHIVGKTKGCFQNNASTTPCRVYAKYTFQTAVSRKCLFPRSFFNGT